MIGARVARPAYDYAALRATARDAGLFDRQPVFYIKLAILLAVLLAASVLLLVIPHPGWVTFLDAVLFAVTFVQIGFVGHDAAHRQVFARTTRNDVLAILCFNIGLGGSAGWWRDKHNQHHASPNHEGGDPDIDMKVVAFTPEQARDRRGIIRLIVRYQAFLFVFLAMFVYPTMQLKSAQYLLSRRDRRGVLEALAMVVHYPLFLVPVIVFLGIWQAVAFTVVIEAVMGVYLAASFAPNHKGMPIIEEGRKLDFMRAQVETSRNIRRGLLADFAFGSLSAQIEHHLFPTMPRNNLRKAEPLVREFCAESGIEYHEASVIGSFSEMLSFLHSVGKAAARVKKAG